MLALALAVTGTRAQVNTGSDGHDGAFNPTTNTVIDMADHPDGIYHHTSANISNGVTVTFIPNANNRALRWGEASAKSEPAWESVSNAPAISTDRYVLTNSWSEQSRFFRLRRR